MLSCDLSLITIHISDCRQFSEIHISQGSVATYFRCGGIFKYEFVAKFTVESVIEKILKIGLDLEKLWARIWCLVF